MTNEPCTPRELQLVEASRWLSGSRVIVIGSGAAFAIGPLARRTTAEAACFVIDSGVVDARLERALVSVLDPRMPSALRMGSMSGVFLELLQGGRVDTSLLSAAQVDAEGNLNSNYLGSASAPTKRFPGAGGATAMAALSRRLVVVVRHERRRFVEHVDFVSCAGPLIAPQGVRRELVVVTDLCVMRCDRERPRLAVTALMPGVSGQTVQENTGFRLDVPSSTLPLVEPVAPDVLHILREEVDTSGIYRDMIQAELS